ncbi:MAG: hypothetical protein GF398_12385 [Chitinivibrionales bacterium]|nr:hypothetical protein [Chitinivibrionales bacterium]
MDQFNFNMPFDNEQPEATPAFDQADADVLAHRLWVAFNNVGLYGESHPLTRNANKGFYEQTQKCLAAQSPITFHREQETLVCEEWKIQPKNYGQRLITRMKDARIQSISIYPELESDFIKPLMLTLNNINEYPDVDAIARRLTQLGIKGLKFNYVTYQKVTIDESIVRRDLQKLADVFAIDAEQEETEKSDEIYSQPKHIGKESSASAKVKIQKLREKLNSTESTDVKEMPTVDELVDIVNNLRHSLSEELGVTGGAGTVGSEQGEAVSELEQLTYDVIIKLVREEYRKGTLTVKSLAQLLKRLIPDTAELKKLLPQIKAALLKEGMPVAEYLQLVKELARELDSDGLMDILKEAGDEIGVSVEDILTDLRRNPKAAVRLIILASEIGSLLGADQERMAELISTYMERIGREFTLGGQDDEHNKQNTLQALEQELLNELNIGAYRPVAGRIGAEMLKTRPYAEQELSADLTDTNMVSRDAVQELAGAGSEEVSWNRARSEMEGKGYDADAVSEVYNLATEIGKMVDDQKHRSGMEQSVFAASRHLPDAQNALSERDNTVSRIEQDLNSWFDKLNIPQERRLPIKQSFLAKFSQLISGIALDSSQETPHAAQSLPDERARVIDSLARHIDTSAEHTYLASQFESLGFDPAKVTSLINLANDISSLIATETSEAHREIESFILDTSARLAESRESNAVDDESLHGFTRKLQQHGIPPEAIDKCTDALRSGFDALSGKAQSEAFEETPESMAQTMAVGKQKVAVKKKAMPVPKSVMRPKELKKQLDLELKRYVRYKTPLSALAVSIGQVRHHEHRRPPAPEEIADLIPQLCTYIAETMRDLDLIALPGPVHDNYLMIVLSMTDKDGAEVVQNRLQEQLTDLEVDIDGEEHLLSGIVTRTSMLPKKSATVAAFLRRVRMRHNKERDGDATTRR